MGMRFQGWTRRVSAAVSVGMIIAGLVCAGVGLGATGRPSSASAADDAEAVHKLASGVSCGIELWPIKVLTDPNAGLVDTTNPATTTIAAIDALPVPTNPASRAGDQYELHSYIVTATLTGYKLEADSDYHLVITDGSRTMIAEIPLPTCASGSKVLAQITKARTSFEAAHPQSQECFNCLHQTVTMVGIGFFDKLHGQTGVAPNGAELHPVLGFAIGGAPQPQPTTTTTTTTPVVTVTNPPAPKLAPVAGGLNCNKYPGRHYLHGRWHSECKANYFTTP
jgi:hypothetical protein